MVKRNRFDLKFRPIVAESLRALAKKHKKTITAYLEDKILEEVVVIPGENNGNDKDAGFRIITRDNTSSKSVSLRKETSNEKKKEIAR